MSYEGKMKKNSNFWCLRKCTCLYYFYLKKIAKVILAHFSKIAYLSFLWEEFLLLIMFIMPGEKQMVTWWRGYLVVVSQDNKQLQRPAVG